MRISFAHHLSLSSLGGGEKWVVQVAKALVDRGHVVEVYATPVHVAGGAPADPRRLLGDIPYSAKYRQTVKADVCYITYHPLFGLNFRTKGKRIIGIHATTCWEPIDFKYGFLPVQAQILHRFFGHSELMKANAIHTVAGYLNIQHPQVFRIPNFVDSERFVPCKKSDQFTIGYISRKSYQKGWDTFQEVERKLRGQDVAFRISGHVAEEDLPKFIGECHVAVVPSRYDSYGLAIVESLMCEVPVITTPLPSHLALDLPMTYATNISEYVNGILRAKSDFEKSPEEYSALCRDVRRRALKYDKLVIMNRLESMFTDVYGGD